MKLWLIADTEHESPERVGKTDTVFLSGILAIQGARKTGPCVGGWGIQGPILNNIRTLLSFYNEGLWWKKPDGR